MPDARAIYEAVVADLTPAPATAGHMFGMPCLKSARTGKAFAGFYQEAMVFKLGQADLDRALALPGAHVFDPSGTRPMTGWVVVPVDSAGLWPELAEAALRGLPS